MRPIDSIAHVGGCRECLETMQKAGRHVQMVKGVVVEKECLLSAEGWRASPDVDKHIMHRAVGAANEFRLTAPGSSVHAPDNPFHRTGLGVLNERRGESRPAEVVVEDGRVEGACEQAAVVSRRLRDKNENVCQIGGFDTHKEMLP